MPTADQPSWSADLPRGGPGPPGTPVDGDGPMYAFFMTTIRVEVDPRTEEVTEVLVDEDSMQQPTLVLRTSGGAVTPDEHQRVAWITSRSEWPSWDYGSVRASRSDGPRPGQGRDHD